MRLVLAKTGPAVQSPPFLRAVLAIDMLAAIALAGFGVHAVATDAYAPDAWPAWALVGYGVAVLATDQFSARLVPRGLTWRRRLGYLAMGAVVWRGGPFNHVAIAVPVILWSGVVWVALVTGGRTLSRAIARATGEDKPE